MSSIIIVGGDKRNLYLAEQLYQKGCDVCTAFIDESPCAISDGDIKGALRAAKIVILPLPCSKDKTNINAPLGSAQLSLEDLSASISADALVFGGKIDKEMFEKKGICAYDYAEREDFAALNAVPTAEGAIEAVMKILPVTIFGSRVLVTGFGKCAKVLSLTLKAMGARVTVCARSSRDLSMAKALGFDTVPLKHMHMVLEGSDIIFNTVPHRIFGLYELDKIPPHTPLADIASLPGGADPAMAADKNINYVFLPGIPGKYSPYTAAEIILKTIENIIAESGKDAKLWIYGKKE